MSRRISPVLLAILLCVLLEAVERVSNTQGTYHDFPRASYDPRALRPLSLRPPPFDGIIGRRTDHILGNEEDSLEFMRYVPDHSVLYLDPPYNFRQYTAYYFLLNVLCRYPSMELPEEYFAQIQFVRGQNMSDDFTSTFSKSGQFLPSLQQLIKSARTTHVVMSYFDGRNHWNSFNSECNGIADQKLRTLFHSNAFVQRSLRVAPISRLNYQSYGGFRAREINELLFLVEKAKHSPSGRLKASV